MKNILISNLPKFIALLVLALILVFFEYYLHLNTEQFAREFRDQNAKELYSIDTLKIASRLNSLSGSINWVCIQGSFGKDNKIFYSRENGSCESNIWKRQLEIKIPEADHLQISFTLRLPKETETLFLFFFVAQSLMTFLLIYFSRKSELVRVESEMKLLALSRQMFHDIRSPLAALKSLSKNLSSNSSNSEEILLQKSIDKITEISNSLLDSSRSNLLEEFDSIESIQSIVQIKLIELKSALITFNSDSINKCIINGNRIEFERIISNLINNSFESKMGEEINISILLKCVDNSMQLTITDNGKGITEKTLAKIGKKQFTTKSKGNGLGLTHAITKIEQWHGEFKIESQVNLGTTITITLPVISINKSVQYILLDDDELSRLNWDYKAKKAGVNLLIFINAEQLLENLNEIALNSIFYIDSELGKTKGEDLALKLFELGYTELYLTTGHSKNRFTHLNYIKDVIDKTPPF